MRFDELRVGLTAERVRDVTVEDIQAYAALTGDHNPVHVDADAAAKSRFGGIVAHGMLGAGFISAVLGMDLPGPGSVYVGQTIRFTLPVRPGDAVTVRVEILEIIQAKRRVRLATTCRNQNGETVLDGEATILMPEEPG
ncbi:MAG: MaoC family dehydratase [Gemmatimonadetes bacterium]|nr:MaoC family dehydratase [Gemmatimonadota bacterium]